jgi:hypothetical protein
LFWPGLLEKNSDPKAMAAAPEDKLFTSIRVHRFDVSGIKRAACVLFNELFNRLHHAPPICCIAPSILQ